MSLRQRLSASDREAGQPGGHSPPLSTIQGQIHHRIVMHLAKERENIAASVEDEDQDDGMRAHVITLALEIIERDYTLLSPTERERVVEGVCDDVFAFGPITSLLADPEVTEVMVNGPGAIYVERNGLVVRTPCSFRDARHAMSIVERILAPLGRRVDDSSPMVDARLPDGSRVNVIIPPVCLSGPTVTIRKFKHSGLDMDGLVRVNALTREMAEFLKACVKSRLNIVVSGGTASGKTTLLNALSNFIPADERIITIEDAAELRLRQGHVISLEARPVNAEGRGEVKIRDLLRNALRMRPDRIVIGEVRGGEALDLLQAMNTGHDGSLSTLHANKPRDALARLETMALMSNLELPVRVLRAQVSSAIDLIVHLERFEDGTRRVAQITEVQGMEGDVVTLQDVFLYDRTGTSPDGKVQGHYHRSAIRPGALETFRRFGLSVAWGVDSAGGIIP